MSFRPRRLALAFAVTLSAALPLTTSKTASAQDDAAIQMARERFQEGVKYYDAKQYSRARAAFLQAYALKKHPAVLLNLAQSELRSGYEADAAKHFAQYLREANDATAAERQEAQKGLTAAKASIAEIAVNVDQNAAEVYVDGNLEGQSPLPGPIYLKPGAHNIDARKDGRTASSAVTAIAGQSGSVNVSFAGGAAAAPVGPEPTGPATGPAPMGAVQQPVAGQPMPSGPPPDTGTEKPGFVEWATGNPVAWIGGGVAVVGIASGIGFALAAKQSYSDADSIKSAILQEAANRNVSGPCNLDASQQVKDYFGPACDKYQTRVDDGDSQKSVSTVSFVVAGVAVAGTVVYYFIDTGSREAKVGKTTRPNNGFRAAVVPFVGPTERGLGFVGQF
jgi:hypothetical protein